jgi:DNA-binding LytR/AlgR family response regulator
MLLKAIIVDDEPVARKVLREYIEDIDYLELAGTAENPLKADALLADGKIDLLFLDINMPKLNGIEYLRIGGRGVQEPMVIITTAYAEYALEGFELDVVDYLVKPISFERFLKACNKARAKHAERVRIAGTSESVNEINRGADHFFVKCGDSLEKIGYSELVYVEAMTNYVVLHTGGRKLIAYLTLKGLLAQLPPERFTQVHKSFVVNREMISSIRGNTLQLGTTTVPVSQHFYEAAMREILKDKVVKRN